MHPGVGGSAWESARDLFYSAKAASEHPHLQFIITRSFGCGVDALAADRAHALMRADGRIYAELKLDQIVDLAAVRIRLRSLAYANRQREGEIVTQDVALPQAIEPREDTKLASMPAWPEAPGKKQERQARAKSTGPKRKPASAQESKRPSRERAVRLTKAMEAAGYELFFDGGDDQQNQFMACTFLCKIMFIGSGGEMKNFYTWDEVDHFLAKLA